ncbi:transcriptional regulator, AraC family [Chitinophaga costaii]|uniref:Transcriptional regulator, AraC family n=1 Tax=Chitinophaga costaii TaxID=1335309 RepID=A0A1C4EUU6_9BACT|nr:AraC family transcriptional regulator [Chitinophaga costaii]PUZ21637.1 AraC family transcriptional regulator [Chitinophaga costaii]SCC47311.1 transcriptional regulator, AraC family [Chitinophaga costaii]
MGLIASLPEINKRAASVFVMHEKSEKLIPLHSHNKGQLSYVEGGIAYITIEGRTYVVPARHYFWIPQGIPHVLRIGNTATVLRSLYFYAHDDPANAFYTRLGIYPASELLIQMINHTERWDGRHVDRHDYNFEFLVALKQLLPELNNEALPIVLPVTENDEMQKIIRYLERNIGEPLTLPQVGQHFNKSERSLSRLFRATLQISFLQYLKTLRMIKAIEMIVKTKRSISDIAFAVGYNNLGAFSNAFFEFTQSRPSDFRKR